MKQQLSVAADRRVPRPLPFVAGPGRDRQTGQNRNGTQTKRKNIVKYWTILLASAAVVLPLAGAHAQAIDGLYIAGGAGINYLQPEGFRMTIPGAAATGSVSSEVGPAVVMSVGWGFGNGIRAEVEGSFRQNSGFSNPNGFGFGNFSGNEQKLGAMMNVLYDFVGVMPMIQPYIGVGFGYQSTSIHGLSGNLAGVGGRFASSGGERGSFAYQAMFGASYPIDSVPGLAITAEYRFMGLADNRNYGARIGGVNGTITSTDNFNHSFLLGLRYAFGIAPAAAAPMPAADNGAKTFLVFFDWDRADLSGRSPDIIRDAAVYSTKSRYTRIDVDGNTDTSGTPGYNQGLSERRANAVAAELVRNGVPRSAIQMHAFGETRLLVPTGDNTREPQNRRVEIVYR